MSPRRNRPARPGRSGGRGRSSEPAQLDPELHRRGVDKTVAWGFGQWRVRQIPGSAAVKTYRCPGCDQEVRPGTPHVVVWPVDDPAGEAERRHWHTGCWGARDRRRPTR